MDSQSRLQLAGAFAGGVAACTLAARYLGGRKGNGGAAGAEDVVGDFRGDEMRTGDRDALPADIREEFFSRSISYFNGDPGSPDETRGFEALQGAFVVVVGLGGVGSHCAHMLARGGIGRMRIVDFDQVTLSSLNRHATAGVSDVGVPKAFALASALAKSVPTCEVQAVNRMFTADAAAELLAPWDGAHGAGDRPRYVLDCIDDLNTKAELLAACDREGLKVLASMGAGGKADPTRVRIGQLVDCSRDPLASKLRWKLKKLDAPGAATSLACYSSEQTKRGLLPLTEEQKQQPREFGVVEQFRLRVLPVLGTTPAIFGQAMASFALSEIGERPYEPAPVDQISNNLRAKLLKTMLQREKAVFHNGSHAEAAAATKVDLDDVDFLASEVWRARSPFSNEKLLSRVTFTLMRWRWDRPCAPDNLVLMTVPECSKFIERHGEGKESLEAIFGAAKVAQVDARLRDMCGGLNW